MGQTDHPGCHECQQNVQVTFEVAAVACHESQKNMAWVLSLTPIINHIKGSLTSRCQLDLKLVTFFFTMAMGREDYSDVSKAQLKRDIASLSHDLYNISL